MRRWVNPYSGCWWTGGACVCHARDYCYLGAVAPSSRLGSVVDSSPGPCWPVGWPIVSRAVCPVCPVGRRPALLGPGRGVAAHFL